MIEKKVLCFLCNKEMTPKQLEKGDLVKFGANHVHKWCLEKIEEEDEDED